MTELTSIEAMGTHLLGACVYYTAPASCNRMACMQDIPLIIADADDPSSLDMMATQTEAVIALTGPYAQYGTAAVAACVKQGTHWCDLTGKKCQSVHAEPFDDHSTAAYRICRAHALCFMHAEPSRKSMSVQENRWIRDIIDSHHEQARHKGVKIVTCCSFDSIPAGAYPLPLASVL